MNDLTLFCNKLLEDNQKIVEYHINNKEDVDYYKDENRFDKEMLIALIEAFKENLENDQITPFIKTKIIKNMIAMILAIRETQKDSGSTKVR